MEQSRFVEKLNKIDGNIYVIEEEIHLNGGAYEAELQHDNINPATFAIYTGPKLTGERLETYTLSTPSMAPWKRVVRVYAQVPVVYISYETEGDTVEGDDVNRVQTELVRTQEVVTSEEIRAREAETVLTDGLAAEVRRAQGAEATIDEALQQESRRAAEAEQRLTDELAEEIGRAQGIEKKLTNDLSAEEQRAALAERTNADHISAEITRAKGAEKALTDNLSAETTRAKAAEKVLTDDLALEATRAKAAEKIAADDLSGEVVRAKAAEKVNSDAIAAERTRAAAVEAEIQYPAYTQAGTLENLNSSEKLNVSLGKIMKAIAEFIAHKADVVSHITSAERTKWNAVTNKVDKVSGKVLSTNDYTTVEKNKLAGIATGAEVNVQADWSVTDAGSDAYIKGKPAAMPASDVSAWAKAASKPAYSWTEITSKPSTFTPAAHTHTKSQISDMPTKLSQFTNDPGYLTAADVDTSQNHTHANKAVLDKITQSSLDTWNGKAGTAVATQTANGLMAAADKKKLDGVAAGANNYAHPTTSGNKHIPSGGASGQILRWSADGTAVWGADNNTDTKITQTNTTGSADYRLLLSANANDTSETNTGRKSANFIANPATGEFYAKGYRRINITGQTLDINTLNLSAGSPTIMRYIEKTSGGAANITNLPVTGQPFLLDVELIRWASATDYITVQTFRNAANPNNEYVRYCTSGTWNNWVTRVFTDTKYTHPNSGVAAGTYRSVTVNAQGHVTGGSNPTTLAGYGITDAAAKTHNHDGTYLKKSGLTWSDLKGV